MRLPQSPPTLAEAPGTGDVQLRPHRPADLGDLLSQCQDEQSLRWTSLPLTYDRVDGEEYLAGLGRQWASGQYLALAVERGGRYAGTVDLRPRPGDVAELGYALAPWARGRGVTERALRLLLPWAFDEIGLVAIHWTAVVGNWSSRRVAWSVGFRVDGRLPDWWAQRGQARTTWVGVMRRGDPLSPAHPWHRPPVLRADPVVLRPHADTDDVAMAEACSDPQTQYWLAQMPDPYTVRQAREHLAEIGEQLAGGRALYWAVADARDPNGPLRGEIGLRLNHASDQGEIGYWSHPLVRRQGFTTQAVRLVARHALLPAEDGGLGLSRVLLRAAEYNTASQRIARRVGFRLSGRDRNGERMRDGGVQDMLRFDLLPTECP